MIVGGSLREHSDLHLHGNEETGTLNYTSEPKVKRRKLATDSQGNVFVIVTLF
jgi:hypothetical protein